MYFWIPTLFELFCQCSLAIGSTLIVNRFVETMISFGESCKLTVPYLEMSCSTVAPDSVQMDYVHLSCSEILVAMARGFKTCVKLYVSFFVLLLARNTSCHLCMKSLLLGGVSSRDLSVSVAVRNV